VLSLVLVSWFPQVGCAPHCSSAESDFSAVPTLSFCRQEAARFRSCAKDRFFSALSSGQFVIFLLKNFWPSSRFSVEDFSSRSSAREPVHPDLGFRSSLFIFPAVSRFRVEILWFSLPAACARFSSQSESASVSLLLFYRVCAGVLLLGLRAGTRPG
jgi:hypothetical protein